LTIAAHSGTTGSWDWDALAGWDVGNLTPIMDVIRYRDEDWQ
jgi:hypothetical protein